MYLPVNILTIQTWKIRISESCLADGLTSNWFFKIKYFLLLQCHVFGVVMNKDIQWIVLYPSSIRNYMIKTSLSKSNLVINVFLSKA